MDAHVTHMKEKGHNRVVIATAVAIFFHLVGLLGILFYDVSFFARMTPWNLCLMFLLILYTHGRLNRSFLFFLFIGCAAGILIEIIGTQTGWLFGSYWYGTILGPAIFNVPFMIGVNWFIVMYCCGSGMQWLLQSVLPLSATVQQKPVLYTLSMILDGALLAVIFDWIMEPVAIRLGFWTWAGDGSVPLYNYICWFLVSMCFLYFFNRYNIGNRNKFALHLWCIQAMFFLLLRTFL